MIMQNRIVKMSRYTLLVVFFIVAVQSISAQINPSPSQYFYNKLFQNVAATGMEKGARIDGSFRNMTPNTFVGSPVNTMVSLQGAVGTKSGLGIQFQNERAGLLGKSRLIGSYAIDLSQGDTRIRLGVGMGMLMTRVVTGNGVVLRGDANDPMIAVFNSARVRIDGSVGGLIETKGWEILASIPSLGMIQEFRGFNAIDYTLANAMVSKKFKITSDEEGGINLQPMLGYSMLGGVRDVLDLGAKLNYRNQLQFMALYHSNNEVAFGVGIPFKDKLAFNFTYNTGKVYNKNYMNVGGTIEAHVMYRF